MITTSVLYCFSVLLSLISFSHSPTVEVIKLEEGVYVYHSFAVYEGELVSANGLIVESLNEVAIIDTPWDHQQTTQLLDWIHKELNKPVAFAVITHAHMDRIGGIDVLKSHNIPTISGGLTFGEAAKNGYAQPDFAFQSDTLLTYGNSLLEAYYPGPGHTVDNTVIYLNDHHILYGGCFIKSSSSTSLGNLEDANTTEWPISVQNVVERYPERKQVIPGHGNWKSGAIENTLKLLSKNDR